MVPPSSASCWTAAALPLPPPPPPTSSSLTPVRSPPPPTPRLATPSASFTPPTRPPLMIQDGRDSRCSSCVIPFGRGKSRGLPPDSVIPQIQKLTVGQTFLSIPSGSLPAPFPAREIVLSGINLGTYGRDLSPR